MRGRLLCVPACCKCEKWQAGALGFGGVASNPVSKGHCDAINQYLRTWPAVLDPTDGIRPSCGNQNVACTARLRLNLFIEYGLYLYTHVFFFLTSGSSLSRRPQLESRRRSARRCPQAARFVCLAFSSCIAYEFVLLYTCPSLLVYPSALSPWI